MSFVSQDMEAHLTLLKKNKNQNNSDNKMLSNNFL